MAISNGTAWELRTTGDDQNGSGYDPSLGFPASQDHSQSDTPHEIYIKLLSTSGMGSTTLVRKSGAWTTADVGNCIYITGGLNFVTGIYQITNYVSSTSVVLDHSPTPVGAGTAGDGRLGGAQSDPKAISAIHVAGNRVWCKAGTYLLTSAWVIPDGVGTLNSKIRWTGYSTSRGDASYPVAFFDGNAAAYEAMKIGTLTTNYGHYIFEFCAWKNAGTGYAAIDAIARNNLFWRCGAYDTKYDGFRLYSYGNIAIGCETYNFGNVTTSTCGFRLYTGSAAVGCYAHASSAQIRYGFRAYHGAVLDRCIARGCYRGIHASMTSESYQIILLNCGVYGSANAGFYINGNKGTTHLINCLAINNGTFGLDDAHTTGATINLSNFAHYGNGSGGIDTGGPSEILYLGGLSPLALTEQPFMDPTNHDFRIKSHMTELLRTGFPEDILNQSALEGIPQGIDFGPTQSPWHGRRT